MPAQTKNLWAPLIKAHRGKDWFCWTAVAATRTESKRLFLKDFQPEYYKNALRTVRFVRVTITEQVGASHRSFQGGAS